MTVKALSVGMSTMQEKMDKIWHQVKAPSMPINSTVTQKVPISN